MSPPIPYPVHNTMLDPVAMEFEDDPTLLKLFKRPRDTKTACSIVMPETGEIVTKLKNPTYLAVEVVQTVLTAKMDWPSTLKVVANANAKEVVRQRARLELV